MNVKNNAYEIIGENRAYGQCDFEYDKVNKTVEPAEKIRGDIARIQLYLEDKYGEVLGFKFSFINFYIQIKPPCATYISILGLSSLSSQHVVD